MGKNEDIPIYVLVRLWGNKHSHILSLEIQNGTTFLGCSAIKIPILHMYLTFDPAIPLLRILTFPQVHC